MTKQQYKNLSRSFRKIRSKVNTEQAFAYIGFYSNSDRRILEKVYI